MSTLFSLPKNVVHHILRLNISASSTWRLAAHGVMSMALTCKEMNLMADDLEVWNDELLYYFGIEPETLAEAKAVYRFLSLGPTLTVCMSMYLLDCDVALNVPTCRLQWCSLRYPVVQTVDVLLDVYAQNMQSNLVNMREFPLRTTYVKHYESQPKLQSAGDFGLQSSLVALERTLEENNISSDEVRDVLIERLYVNSSMNWFRFSKHRKRLSTLGSFIRSAGAGAVVSPLGVLRFLLTDPDPGLVIQSSPENSITADSHTEKTGWLLKRDPPVDRLNDPTGADANLVIDRTEEGGSGDMGCADLKDAMGADRLCIGAD